MRYAPLIAALLWAPIAAHGDGHSPTVLRLSTVAPDGTPQARALKLFARNVEARTDGRVQVKWYFSGIAGDEAEQGERISRGQLDGTASVNMLCERLAPAMRVNRLPGLFDSRDEAAEVMNRLQPVFEADAHRAGYSLLATVSMGAVVLFSRVPVHSMAELKQLRIWLWDLDDLGVAVSRKMGLNVVPLPISDAARAFDEGRIDGFLTVPGGAVAFQWLSRVRYMIDLRGSYLPGCLIVAERTFNALPIEQQQAIRAAAATLRLDYTALGEKIDAQLLGGLFQKQGGKVLPVSPQLRAEFSAAAQAAREQIADRFVPRSLLDRVLKVLAQIRSPKVSAGGGGGGNRRNE
jgi:TRAP-type C4-dicarboxylate transport system substrate-binding protein